MILMMMKMMTKKNRKRKIFKKAQAFFFLFYFACPHNMNSYKEGRKVSMIRKIPVNNQEKSLEERIKNEVLPYLAPDLRVLLNQLPTSELQTVEEIRLRIHAPVLLKQRSKDHYLTAQGNLTEKWETSLTLSKDTMDKTVSLLSNSSLYALEEELQKGFLTLPGGHRVGFVGRAVLEGGKIRTLKQISGVNIRIARFITGSAYKIIDYLVEKNTFLHTLVISPPQAGKTTLVRDIITLLSNGFPGFKSIDVGLVDERSEIAGCLEGIPQLPIGHRTDVLDGCPKAEGMMMLVRSMSPQVIATDEVGRKEDGEAMEEVIHAGIKILTTVHGMGREDLLNRPVIREFIKEKVFERYVVLSRKNGPGTIEQIYDREWNPLLGRMVKPCSN
jgi:stage III sporulation protein AA